MPDSLTHSLLGILYSFRRCPYAMRARLACTLFLPPESLELREVVLKNKPQALLDISPKATVPVLLVLGGPLATPILVDESRDIIRWALEKGTLGQATDALKTQFLPLHLQLEIEELIDENDGAFKWALDRYKYSDRFEESKQYYRKLGEIFLAKLERLLEHNRYLFAQEMSLADIAIFPFVRQFAHVDKAWFEQSQYPRLIQWLSALLESELFVSIMGKYKPWQVDNDAVYFPK
jgi:glutathione S-transferase